MTKKSSGNKNDSNNSSSNSKGSKASNRKDKKNKDKSDKKKRSGNDDSTEDYDSTTYESSIVKKKDSHGNSIYCYNNTQYKSYADARRAAINDRESARKIAEYKNSPNGLSKLEKKAVKVSRNDDGKNIRMSDLEKYVNSENIVKVKDKNGIIRYYFDGKIYDSLEAANWNKELAKNLLNYKSNLERANAQEKRASEKSRNNYRKNTNQSDQEKNINREDIQEVKDVNNDTRYHYNGLVYNTIEAAMCAKRQFLHDPARRQSYEENKKQTKSEEGETSSIAGVIDFLMAEGTGALFYIGSTALASSTTCNPVTLAAIGPVIEKIGIASWEGVKKAYSKITGKESKLPVGVGNAVKNILMDVFTHDIASSYISYTAMTNGVSPAASSAIGYATALGPAYAMQKGIDYVGEKRNDSKRQIEAYSTANNQYQYAA